MVIKIYFNDKPLLLCDQISDIPEGYMHTDNTVFIDELSTPVLVSMIHKMRSQTTTAGVYYHADLSNLKKALWKRFNIVQAAGGIVLNEQDEILFMFRRGKWDLPKGKLDPGESLEECAVREVQEETGLREVFLRNFFLTTFHTYEENQTHILKESYWYTMQAAGKQELIPQLEEDIHEVKWVKKEHLPVVLGNTYRSISDVINNFLQG